MFDEAFDNPAQQLKSWLKNQLEPRSPHYTELILVLGIFSLLPVAVFYSRTSLFLYIPLACCWCALQYDDYWMKVFWILFTLRYTRTLGHLVSAWFYKPAPGRSPPLYTPKDVTVILPTINPRGAHFDECIRTILDNKPAALMIVTAGEKLLQECKTAINALKPADCKTEVTVSSVKAASKRRQVAHAVRNVTTTITITADDHVFWTSPRFLVAMLAPFESPRVNIVGSRKRVRRTTPGEYSWKSVINFITCNYLQRHNWELRSSNAIDGGLFVVSGRTAAYRTSFLQDPYLLEHFCNEKFFFGLLGGEMGLGPDDDNFLTREAMKNGQHIRFQDTPDATIETAVGEWPNILGQMFRWARTTFRSNPVVLRSPTLMKWYPWSYFNVYLAGIVNFAIVWDPLMVYAIYKSQTAGWQAAVVLFLWIIWTKTLKLWPHFVAHPSDIKLLPVQIVFAYIHSFIKLWALLTFWDCGWTGRKIDNLIDGGAAAKPLVDKELESTVMYAVSGGCRAT